MADPAERLENFRQLLTVTCGLNTDAHLDAITVTQGMESLDDFGLLTISEIELMVVSINKMPRPANARFVISAPSLKYLKILRVWIKWQQAMGLPITEELYNLNARSNVLQRMDFEERLKMVDPVAPVVPDKLKHITNKDWIAFWRQFDAYCSQIRGTLKLPLSYVYREHVEVTDELAEADYPSSDDRLSNMVALEGNHFEEDNKAVWLLFVPLVNSGPAWPTVKRFETTRNAREAIISLKTLCTGTDAIQSRRTVAYNALDTLKYNGSSTKFTFDHLLEKMYYYYNELYETDQQLTESKKVDYLLRSTKDCVVLKSAYSLVLSDPIKMNDFDSCVTYFKNTLSNHKSYEPTTSRNVSVATTSASKPNQMKYASDGTCISYPPAEWKKLPQATKDKVIKKRKEMVANGELPAPKKTPSSDKASLNKMKRKIQSLSKDLTKLKNGDSDADESMDDSNTATVKKVTSKKAKTSKNDE